MRMLKCFLVLPLCLSCCYAFMFSSLREKGKEPQGKVPCGGHFRIRQNLPEHAQGWLGSKWLWLSFVIVLYVILKFRGDSEKNKVSTAASSHITSSQPHASSEMQVKARQLHTVGLTVMVKVSRHTSWHVLREDDGPQIH